MENVENISVTLPMEVIMAEIITAGFILLIDFVVSIVIIIELIYK